MQKNNIDRVHRLADLYIYDLELSKSVRHPVRFLFVNDILRAAGEEVSENYKYMPPVTQVSHIVTNHSPACNCRFCATDLLDTRVLKRTLP